MKQKNSNIKIVVITVAIITLLSIFIVKLWPNYGFARLDKTTESGYELSISNPIPLGYKKIIFSDGLMIIVLSFDRQNFICGNKEGLISLELTESGFNGYKHVKFEDPNDCKEYPSFEKKCKKAKELYWSLYNVIEKRYNNKVKQFEKQVI